MTTRFTFLRPLLSGLGQLCFFFVAASSVHAQSEPPPQPATLRFLFLDESGGAYALKLDEQFKPISASPYTISPPYIPVTLDPLEIYKTSSVRDPGTGEFPRVKVATFTPPANTTSSLVILTPQPPAPGSTTPTSCNVEFIDSAPSAFPGGSIRILNRGRVAMAARLARAQITVEPGTEKIISPVADQRGRLRVMVAVQTPEQWKLIDDSVVFVMPDTRVTGVLVFSPSGMKFRMGPYILAERGDPPPSHVWLTYTDSP